MYIFDASDTFGFILIIIDKTYSVDRSFLRFWKLGRLLCFIAFFFRRFIFFIYYFAFRNIFRNIDEIAEYLFNLI